MTMTISIGLGKSNTESGLPKTSHFLSASIQSALVGAALSAAPQAIAQGSKVQNQIEGSLVVDVSEAPSDNLTFGAAYDTRKRVFTGKTCLNFAAENIILNSDDPAQESTFIVSGSDREIANEMEMSVAASARFGYGGVRGYANSKFDVMEKAETSRKSRTMLAKVVDPLPYEIIDIDASNVLLEDRWRETYMESQSRFRENCGDAFVIGIQKGHYFYGVANLTETQEQQLSQRQLELGFGVQYTGNEAESEFERVNRALNEQSGFEFKADVISTRGGGGSTSLDEMAAAFKAFSGAPITSSAGAKQLKFQVVSYDKLNNYPVRNPLAPRTNEGDLDTLKDALWEARSRIKELDIYLDPKNHGDQNATDPQRVPRYAYGYGATAGLRLLRLRQLRNNYDQEFSALRDVILSCMEDFTSKCRDAADLYQQDVNSGARIQQWESEFRDFAPAPLVNTCRDIQYTVTDDMLAAGFKTYVKNNFATTTTDQARAYPRAGDGVDANIPLVIGDNVLDCDPTQPGVQCDAELGGKNAKKVRTWLNLEIGDGRDVVNAFLGLNVSEHEVRDGRRTRPRTEITGHSQFQVYPPVNAAGDVGPQDIPSSCKINGTKMARYGGKQKLVTLKPSAGDGAEVYGMQPPGSDGALIPGDLADLIQTARDNRAFGYIEGEFGADGRLGAQNFPRPSRGHAQNDGFLTSIRCVGDTKGNDAHSERGAKSGGYSEDGVSCQTLATDPITIGFYPAEDDLANADFDRVSRKGTATPQIIAIRDEIQGSGSAQSSSAVNQAVLGAIGSRPVFGGGSTRTPEIRSAPAETASASTVCRDAIQGKIAWDQAGSQTNWSDRNVETLCGSAKDSTGPAQCFEAMMQTNFGAGVDIDWRKAIALCKGKEPARSIVNCYRSSVQSLGHDGAVSHCRSGY